MIGIQSQIFSKRRYGNPFMKKRDRDYSITTQELTCGNWQAQVHAYKTGKSRIIRERNGFVTELAAEQWGHIIAMMLREEAEKNTGTTTSDKNDTDITTDKSPAPHHKRREPGKRRYNLRNRRSMHNNKRGKNPGATSP